MIAEAPKDLRKTYPWASIGEETYGGLLVYRWEEATSLSIGSYTSFAFAVKLLLGGDHRKDWVTTFPFSALWPEVAHIPGHPRRSGGTKIGNDVWVGADTLILPEVTIGDGAVVGAGAVVNRDVLPYEIVQGNPARHAGYRFNRYTVDRLLRVKWWDWPRSRIVTALPAMLSGEIDSFLNKVEAGEL